MKRIILTALLASLFCFTGSALANDCGNDKDHGKGSPSCKQHKDHDKDHDKEHEKDHDKDPNHGGNGGNGGNGGSSSSSSQQAQNQSQTSTNTNNNQSASSSTSAGNSTTVDTRTTYNQVRQVASAIAPDAFPSSPCIKGYSGAVQTGVFGASAGGGKVDKGCDDRETARSFALMGNRDAAAKILCQTPAAKRAQLTLTECLATFQEPVPVPVVVAPVVIPEPKIVEKIVEVQKETKVTNVGSYPLKLVTVKGTCPVNYTTLTPAARGVLNTAIVLAWEDPNTKIVLEGTTRNTGASVRFLLKSVSSDRIIIRPTESTDKVNVYTWQ